MTKETCSEGHERCKVALGYIPNHGPVLCEHKNRDKPHCMYGTTIGQECIALNPPITPETGDEVTQDVKILTETQLNGLYITLEQGDYVPGHYVKRLKATIHSKDVHIKALKAENEDFRKAAVVYADLGCQSRFSCLYCGMQSPLLLAVVHMVTCPMFTFIPPKEQDHEPHNQ